MYLHNIGGRWRSLTKVEQNAVSVAIAGTMQRERFSALMNNYSDALKYSETAANSAGSALQRYGVYQDSIEAKTNELTAAIESLSTSTISEDMFSGIVEATTGLVEFIDKFGVLKGTLAGFVTMGISKMFVSMGAGIVSAAKSTSQLTAAMAMFRNGRDVGNLRDIGTACKGLSNNQLKLILSTKNLEKADRLLILEGMGIAEAEQEQTLATLGFANAENTATASTFSLKGAMDSLKVAFLSNPIGTIITGLTAVVTTFTMVSSAIKQKQEELIQSTKDAANAYTENSDSISDYVSRYNELQEALKNARGNEQETYNVKKHLLDLQTELNEKFGDEYGAINLVTEAYKNQTEIIRNLNKEAANNFLNENVAGIKDAEEEMTKQHTYVLSRSEIASSDRGAALKEIAEKYEGQGMKLTPNMEGEFFIQLNADPQSAYETINAFENDLRKKAKELGDEDLFDGIFDMSSSELNRAKKVVDEYGDIYKQALTAEIVSDDDKSKKYNEALEAVEAYNEAVLKSEDIYNDENIEKARQSLQEIKGELSGEEWEKYASLIDGVFGRADTGLLDFNEHIKNDDSVKELAEDLKGLDALDLKAFDENIGENKSFDKLKESADSYGLSVDELIESLVRLGYVQGEIADNTIPEPSFTDAISQVQTLSEGLDQLDKIYADVYDKEDFDWSSILNNEGFQKVFGEFTEEYDDFIKTVSNAPDDINACQDAFDRLATAYLYGSEVLKDLTAETKDATIAMLEQMGITNASEIVTARLAAEEAYLAEKKNNTAIAADNLTEATWNEISAVISEGDASEETRAYLAMLALEKINVNNIRLNTDDDVNAIIAIANAAGASTEYINGLKRALSSLASINETIETNGQNEGQAGISASVSKSLAEAQKPHVEQQIEDYLEKIKQGIASTKLNPSDYYAHYGGGSATKAAVDKANKSGKDAKEKKEDIKQFEKVIDHIERRIQKFQRLFD